MQTGSLNYSRNMTPSFFAGANYEDLKWTINYLKGLLIAKSAEKNSTESISLDDAKEQLRKLRLKNHNVPVDFNGMKDEVNSKYL